MGLLDKLTFATGTTTKPVVKKVFDPLDRARETLINDLADQKYFAELILARDELPPRTRLMFWLYRGTYRFLPKVWVDAVKIDQDNPEILCKNLNEVMEVCDTLIEAATAGELDDALKQMIATRPKRGRAKSKFIRDAASEELSEKLHATLVEKQEVTGEDKKLLVRNKLRARAKQMA